MSRARMITMDITDGERAPVRSDLLQTAAGTRYRILSARRVRRRDTSAGPRFALHVRRVELFGGEMHPDTAIWQFAWHPRKKKKIKFEQYMRRLNSSNMRRKV